MKLLKIYLTVILFSFINFIQAQVSTTWDVGGNNNQPSVGFEKIGLTTNNYIQVITNDLTRATFTKGGRLGLGKTDPEALLELNYCPNNNITQNGLIVTLNECNNAIPIDPLLGDKIGGIKLVDANDKGPSENPPHVFTLPYSFRTGNSSPIGFTLNNHTTSGPLLWLRKENPQFEKAVFEFDSTFKVHREVEKMSKSKYNVVNPDEICEKFGTDTLRMYEMFLGPLEQSKPWNTAEISGVHNFLKKFWKLYFDPNNLKVDDSKPNDNNLKLLHKCIKKVSSDIESFSFNTAVSTLMITVNELTAQKCRSKEILEPLLIVLSPFAPHICEEIWERIGNTESIVYSSFPEYYESYLQDSTKIYPVSINGKLKYKIELPSDLSKEDIEAAILSDEIFIKKLEGNKPKRVIVIPGKIINFVI